MSMHVADLMKQRVVTVEMDDSLSMAKSLMENASIHHLPVVDSHQRVVGIVSDRDLLRAISPFMDTAAENDRDLAIMRRPVHQIMTRHPHDAQPDIPLEQAAWLMLDNDISSLPITSEKGQLMGIITWKDVVGYCVKSSLGTVNK